MKHEDKREEVNRQLNKIWKTRKSRIQAAERLKSNYNFYQNITVYYSIIITILSIWNIVNSNSKIGEIILISSIILTIFSVFVKSKNYQKRYFNMKNNYIELDNLYSELKKHENNKYINYKEIDRIRKMYNNLLKGVENHKEEDYIYAMSLASDEELSCKQKRKLLIYKLKKRGINFLFIILPFIIIVLMKLEIFNFLNVLLNN